VIVSGGDEIADSGNGMFLFCIITWPATIVAAGFSNGLCCLSAHLSVGHM